MRSVIRHLSQIPGWRTNRKIVVIESDDWGSIRMSSKSAYQALLKQGIQVDKDLYSKFDSLETEDDLTALFEVLKKFKDKDGSHPVITANTIVANPDFEKIKSDHFSAYHYECFTETLNRNSSQRATARVWKEGVTAGFLRPQFHGREHVNVGLWMKALQTGNKTMLAAFEQRVFGIPIQSDNNNRGNYMAAFDFHDAVGLSEVKNIIADGLKIFNELFGYNSKTIIAPCYVLPDEAAPLLSKWSVKGYQGISYQFSPVLNKGSYKRKFHYTGQSNTLGQYFLVRNAFFEPTHFNRVDMVSEIIQRANVAFFWKKPLIIGAHRINFMGSLDEKNRSQNLSKLELVLTVLLKAFPDIVFLSSDKLVDLISKDNKLFTK